MTSRRKRRPAACVMFRNCTKFSFLLLVSFLQCTRTEHSPLTYDLVRYSNVDISETRSNPAYNTSCMRYGYNYQCLLSAEEFIRSIWKHGAAWSTYFNKYSKEIDIVVKFNRVSTRWL